MQTKSMSRVEQLKAEIEYMEDINNVNYHLAQTEVIYKSTPESDHVLMGESLHQYLVQASEEWLADLEALREELAIFENPTLQLH